MLRLWAKMGLEKLEFEFEFEGSIQIQIPHIGNTQKENQTRKSNNQFKTRKIAIKSEKASNNHTNI
jgi:phage tail tube protein FII